MTSDEFRDYWIPARDRVAGPDDSVEGYDRSHKLAMLLGIKRYHIGGWEALPVTPLLRALAGPHGATVLKVLQIQKADHENVG